MPEITEQITWVYTDNLDATRPFYEEGLGLELYRDAGTARIYRSSPGALIGVCTAFADRVIEPAGSMITLLTDDVDAWYQRLLSFGAVLKGPPEVMEKFGIYSFFAEDPNGYVLEVQTFL